MADRAPARELTKREGEALVSSAFKLERKIKEKVAAEHAAWWDLAEALYEFHEMRGWTLLGYETLQEFLAQPEIGMKKSAFHQAVACWRDLHVTRQLPKAELEVIEPSKAREVRPAIMRGDVKPKQALADAAELGVRDLIEKYRPENIAEHGQAPDGSTPLDADAEPERVQCPHCGSWVVKSALNSARVESPA